MKEARVPMGLRKDQHIREIMRMPAVSQRWQEAYGRPPTEQDVQALFKELLPMQLSVLRQYGELIPGTAQAARQLREELGCRIGVTTGFFRSMADIVREEAVRQGFVPDADVTGDEVANGVRPKPFMLFRNLELLDVDLVQAVVKVDDTVPGVGEALNAGCWAVGVARYSNYMDVDSLEHEARLTPQDVQERLERTRELLRAAGAHYVIDSLADLPEVVADVNRRLASGEKP